MSEPTLGPGPTPEHQRLAERVGTWQVECTYYVDPKQAPLTVEATEVVEMVGPYWLVSQFEASMMGVPFSGKATTGYQPVTGQFVATWIDSMAPYLFVFRGGYDASGEVLELIAEAPDPGSGEMTTYRTTERSKDPDEREFDMYIRKLDGSEHHLAHYTYRRQQPEGSPG